MQIGGPTGAFVVIVSGIVQQYGIDGLPSPTMMAGVILIIFGLARLGGADQVHPLSGDHRVHQRHRRHHLLEPGQGLPRASRWATVPAHVRAEVGRVRPAPRISQSVGCRHRARRHRWSSSALAADQPADSRHLRGPDRRNCAGRALSHLRSRRSAGASASSHAGTARAGLSAGDDRPTSPLLMGPAFTIALLAAIESLLSAVVADGMIGGRHRSNMELVAQGIANIAVAALRRHSGDGSHRPHGDERQERRADAASPAWCTP